MDRLRDLENNSLYVIREAYQRCRKIALLWSIGKDSTTLLWLCKKAFFGQIPFPILHIDTGFKFSEIYAFRDQYAEAWNLELLVTRNERAIAEGPSRLSRFECCRELKTNALKQAMDEFGFKGLLVGIRRDEHGIRAKERVFSPRKADFTWDYTHQPAEIWEHFSSETTEENHIRIHPLLDWNEIDIWRYIQQENIPFVDLYLAKDGRRYRSIGCECCCNPVESNAGTVEEIITELETTRRPEREGRAQDKESTSTMQKLRALGYM